MITSTPVAFSKARMLRPSRPMMRPFISSLGMSTVLVVVSAGVGGGVALQAGEQHLARLLLAGLGDLPLVAEDHRPGLLLQLRVRAFPAAAGWPPRGSAR